MEVINDKLAYQSKLWEKQTSQIIILVLLWVVIFYFAINNFIVIRKNKRHLETIHILLKERKITSKYPRKLPRVLPVPSSSVLVKDIKVGETAIYFSSIKEEEDVLGEEEIVLGEEAIYSNLIYSEAIHLDPEAI